jgi:hypothetical protein
MKESYREGIASHSGPESCGGAREVAVEALTGVWMGRVLSRETYAPAGDRWAFWGADAVEVCRRQDCERRKREALMDPARSETLSTSRNFLRGSREILCLSCRRGSQGRTGKSKDKRP